MKSLEDGFIKAGLDASDRKDLPPRVYKVDHGFEVNQVPIARSSSSFFFFLFFLGGSGGDLAKVMG